MGLGPLPAVSNVLRIVLKGAGDVYKWANVLHWAYSGVLPTITALETIASDIVDLWISQVGSLVTADNALDEVVLTDLSSDTGAQVEFSTHQVGTNGEDPLPNNVATLIDYPVDLRYRGGHPRTYLNAGGDGNLATGSVTFWNGGYTDEVNAGWEGFTSGVTGSAAGGTTLGDMVCVRYLHDGAYLIPPIVLTLPTFSVSPQIASQRRRVGRK